MAVARSRLAIIVVILVVGLYFLIDHIPPLPLNHEDIGLGKSHLAHAVFGIILIAGGLYLWRKSRKPSKAVAKAKPSSQP